MNDAELEVRRALLKECDQHDRCARLFLRDGSAYHRGYSETGAAPYWSSEQTVTWYLRGWAGNRDDYTITVPWGLIERLLDHQQSEKKQS